MMETLEISKIVVKDDRPPRGNLIFLIASIERLGVLQPLLLNSRYELVAGRRRLAAVKDIGWTEVPVRIVSTFDDALTALKAERDENTCREPITLDELVEIGGRIEALEKPEAKKRQRKAQDGQTKIKSASGKLPEVILGDTRDDVLAEAARTLLTEGGWFPLGSLAGTLGSNVDPGKAVATYERLTRAGWAATDDRAEQERIGRERVIQEALQHLVGRGRVEACGRGESRQYRLREVAMILNKMPKPRTEWVALEQLSFDARLQLRAFPDGKLYDERIVEHYRELRRLGGGDFKTIRAVEEKIGKKTKLWVFSGFHRGEMYRRDGVGSVEVSIYPGTFLDARFWALGENGDHGKHRTPEDCRRAFDELLDTPELLERVMSSVKESGGALRSIAAACRLAESTVGKYLTDRGLQADRKTGRLVPIPKVEVVASLPAVSEPTLSPQPKSEPVSQPQPKPAPSVEQTTVATGDPRESAAKDALAKLQSDIRSIGRSAESILRSPHGNTLRVAAKAKGLALAVKEQEETQGINDPGRTVKIEYWPVLADLQAIFADVSAQVYAG